MTTIEKDILHCDICGHPMTTTGEKGKVVFFSCTNCNQTWSISGIGTSCTILKYLWPSRMEENSKMFREQYIPAWLEKTRFQINMGFIAGFKSRNERNIHLQAAQETYDKWFLEHPLSTKNPKCHWWQFFVK